MAHKHVLYDLTNGVEWRGSITFIDNLREYYVNWDCKLYNEKLMFKRLYILFLSLYYVNIKIQECVQ